jgi:hypothetical protein
VEYFTLYDLSLTLPFDTNDRLTERVIREMHWLREFYFGPLIISDRRSVCLCVMCASK